MNDLDSKNKDIDADEGLCNKVLLFVGCVAAIAFAKAIVVFLFRAF